MPPDNLAQQIEETPPLADRKVDRVSASTLFIPLYRQPGIDVNYPSEIVSLNHEWVLTGQGEAAEYVRGQPAVGGESSAPNLDSHSSEYPEVIWAIDPNSGALLPLVIVDQDGKPLHNPPKELRDEAVNTLFLAIYLKRNTYPDDPAFNQVLTRIAESGVTRFIAEANAEDQFSARAVIKIDPSELEPAPPIETLPAVTESDKDTMRAQGLLPPRPGLVGIADILKQLVTTRKYTSIEQYLREKEKRFLLEQIKILG